MGSSPERSFDRLLSTLVHEAYAAYNACAARFGGTRMANERKHLSSAGLRVLRRHEGAVFHYYNDVARNCTYGVGTLVHHGQCAPEELHRPVTAADVDRQLQSGVHDAETVVRRRVRSRELTQTQF